MQRIFAAICASFLMPIVTFAQSNYALEVKKDTVKINSANFSAENDVVLRRLKNNISGDSVLTTDANGKLKLKKINTSSALLPVTIITQSYLDTGMVASSIEPLIFQLTGNDSSKVEHSVYAGEFDRHYDYLPGPYEFSCLAVNKLPGKVMSISASVSNVIEHVGNYYNPNVFFGDTLAFKIKDIFDGMYISVYYWDSIASMEQVESLYKFRLKIVNEARNYAFNINTNWESYEVPPGNVYDNKSCFFVTNDGTTVYNKLGFSLRHMIYYKSGGIAAMDGEIKNNIQVVVKKNGTVIHDLLIDKNYDQSLLPRDEIDGSWETVEFIIREL